MNSYVDAYLSRLGKWGKETAILRNIILGCGLTEEMKWGKPCYTFRKKNVVIIQGFKDYCAIMFFKGALLQDPERILNKISENTQAARQVRFMNTAQITRIENILRSYIFEAVELEKNGKKVKMKNTSDFVMPEEFQHKLEEIPVLKNAFESLTPGRQRAYIYYFSQAKQSNTRRTRVEKHVPHIIKGKGLND